MRLSIARFFVVACTAVLLSACANTPIPGAFTEAKSYYIAKINVKAAPDLSLYWPAIKDEYFEKHKKPGKSKPASFNDDGTIKADDANAAYFTRLTEAPEAKAYYKQQALTRLRANLEQNVKSTLNGSQPAILEVTLHRVDLSSGVGRALGGSDSRISGDVRLKDARNNTVIAALPNVTGINQGTRMGGTIGAAISLVSNIASAAQGDYFGKTATDFSAKTRNWLLRK